MNTAPLATPAAATSIAPATPTPQSVAAPAGDAAPDRFRQVLDQARGPRREPGPDRPDGPGRADPGRPADPGARGRPEEPAGAGESGHEATAPRTRASTSASGRGARTGRTEAETRRAAASDTPGRTATTAAEAQAGEAADAALDAGRLAAREATDDDTSADPWLDQVLGTRRGITRHGDDTQGVAGSELNRGHAGAHGTGDRDADGAPGAAASGVGSTHHRRGTAAVGAADLPGGATGTRSSPITADGSPDAGRGETRGTDLPSALGALGPSASPGAGGPGAPGTTPGAFAGALHALTALPTPGTQVAVGGDVMQAAQITARDGVLGTAPGQPDFAPALGAQISVLVRDGVQVARLQLHPAELGPVTVQIALDGTQAQLHLSADQAPTRQALEQALPVLAGSLRESGFTLAGGGVFEQPRQDRAPDEHGNDRIAGVGAAAEGDADPAAHPALPLPRRRGVVDLVA